jgi:hypothetical protein
MDRVTLINVATTDMVVYLLSNSIVLMIHCGLTSKAVAVKSETITIVGANPTSVSSK